MKGGQWGRDSWAVVEEESLFDMSELCIILVPMKSIAGFWRGHQSVPPSDFDIFQSVKYADENRPVTVSYRQQEKIVLSSVLATMWQSAEQRESTGIGLKTCQKSLGTTAEAFYSGQKDGFSTVQISFPFIIPGPEN